MIFFSVIIPTYNRAHCILQTIESVLNQNYTDLEIVVVDDGSTDNTAEVIASIADNRIRYFKKENGERGAARNFGAKQAAGEYLFFLDSDDLIKPGYFEHANELIEKGKPKCIHIPYNYLVDGTEKSGPDLSGNILKMEQIQNRFACQIIVHKSCMEAFQFSENRNFKIGEDWYFILLLLSNYQFEIGTKRLGLIVQHENRSMVEAPYSEVLESLQIFETELKKNLTDSPAILKNVQHELTNLAALHAALQRERKIAWKLLLKSNGIKMSRLFRYRNFVIFKKIIFGS